MFLTQSMLKPSKSSQAPRLPVLKNHLDICQKRNQGGGFFFLLENFLTKSHFLESMGNSGLWTPTPTPVENFGLESPTF